MNLMREKGINQQGEIRTNKMRNKTKKGTKNKFGVFKRRKRNRKNYRRIL